MLELAGIRAGYGRVEVLRGIDLVVPTGAAVALLGANGAGKTTLLRVAAGLLAPLSGTVCLDRSDVTGWSASRRSRAGLCLVPEGRGVYPHLTVRENLAMQVRGREVVRAIEQATEMFPVLGSRLDQLAGTLSGGEQQMLAVGRALMANPDLILMDEPSEGLAPVIVEELMRAVKQLTETEVALVLVEQNSRLALEISARAMVMDRGRVVYDGPSEDLRRDPAKLEQLIGVAKV